MQIKITTDRLRQMKVWILIPAAGDLVGAMFSRCVADLVEYLRNNGIRSQTIYLPGDSLVTRARNNLADIFMSRSSSSDDDFALWLDCDILFSAESVLQMLALDLDFVAAPYTKKGLHLDRIAEAARLNWSNDRMAAVMGTPNVNWLANPVLLDQPMPVLEAGTGFWLHKRRVLELMRDTSDRDPAQMMWPGGIRFRRSKEEVNHYGTDHAYAYFLDGIDPETREFLSEDWWFCRQYRRLGGTLYCCFWIKTQHVGRMAYQMDMPAIADLLAATGGYINAETRPKKENTNGEARVPVNGDDDGTNGGAGNVSVRSTGWKEWPVSADEAAIPRDPSALGG